MLIKLYAMAWILLVDMSTETPYSVDAMATKKHQKTRGSGPSTGNPWITAVDLSTLASVIRARTEARERRKAQFRVSQQKRREAQKASGAVTINVTLTAEQFEAFLVCQALQNGPVEGFAARALLMGAKFVANSGRPNGKKVKGGA